MSANDQRSLQGKSQRIFEFLEEYGTTLPDEERVPMERAAELGKKFAERHTYLIKLRRSGGFRSPRSQGVWLYVGGRVVKKYDSPGASKSVTWSRNEIKIQWQSGQSVKVVLRDRGW